MNNSLLHRVFQFYYNGFRTMTWGRKLWVIILIKLFIMFAILKVFFFPDFLGSRFDTDDQRSEYVIDEITNRSSNGNR